MNHIHFITTTLSTLALTPTTFLAVKQDNIHFVFLSVYWILLTIAHNYFESYSITVLFLNLQEVQKQVEISTLLLIIATINKFAKFSDQLQFHLNWIAFIFISILFEQYTYYPDYSWIFEEQIAIVIFLILAVYNLYQVKYQLNFKYLIYGIISTNLALYSFIQIQSNPLLWKPVCLISVCTAINVLYQIHDSLNQVNNKQK